MRVAYVRAALCLCFELPLPAEAARARRAKFVRLALGRLGKLRLADVRAALQEPTVEVSIADRVMAQVAVQAADAAASPSRRGAWRLVWTSAAAAAALALVVWIDGLAARPSRMQVAADSRVMEQASSAGVAVADPARVCV